MNELEKKLNEVKEKLRKSTILGFVAVAIAVVGAILLIVGAAINKKGDVAGNPLFYSGIGIVAAMVAIQLADVVVYRKEINEYYRLKKEIKHSK